MISKSIIDKNSIVYFTACGLADESLESENPTSLKNAAWELGVDVYASTGLNVFGFASEHGFVKCIRDGKCIAVKKTSHLVDEIWKSGRFNR